MPEKEYQRLTRARARSEFAVISMSRSSLWLGKDHLLCVDSSGYSETYKRFYFRDIQAVTTMVSRRKIFSNFWNWVLGIPFVICAVVLTVGLVDIRHRPLHPDDYWGFLGWGIPCGIFFALLLTINLIGKACTCYLRTAVQIEELPSLDRVHRARKALARLRPLIVAAQGELTPEEISLRMRATAGTSPGTETAMTPEASIAPPTTSHPPGAPPVIS